MKSVLFALGFLLSVFGAGATIHYLPASGDPVSRESAVFQYHDGHDDIHFYGTDRWAVFYSAGTYFGGESDSITFTPTSALIYIPTEVANDTLWVELRAEGSNHQPGITGSDLLGTSAVIADAAYGWNRVSLPTIPAQHEFWMIVHYATNSQTRYIAASEGTSEQSYYFEPYYSDDGYYLNMAEWIYPAEFLFGLDGSFSLPGQDVEIALTYIGFDANYAGGASLHPVFTIRNYSGTSANRLILDFTATLPDSLPASEAHFTMNRVSLAPYEERTITFTDTYSTPDFPTQVQITGTIEATEDSTDITLNNTLTRRYDSFSLRPTGRLVENFIFSSDSEISGFWEAENAALNDNAMILDCYPEHSDTLYYRDSSYRRFLYYGLWTSPVAMVSGENRILGDVPNLSDSLSSAYSDALLIKGFLSAPTDSLSASKYPEGDTTVSLYVVNSRTHVFSSYLATCRFHAAIVEKYTAPGSSREHYFMHGLLTGDGEGITGLTYGSDSDDQRFEISYNLGDYQVINSEYSSDRVGILYWLQDGESHRIELCGFIPLSTVDAIAVSNDDPEPAHRSRISFGPNPLRPGGSLRFYAGSAELDKPTTVKIFNIRGQNVRTLHGTLRDLSWDGADENRRPVAGGVYLMRIETRSGVQTARCVFLR
jgi:hypothetical protein